MRFTYYLKGKNGEYIPYIHISEFAARTHLNQSTVRNMLSRVEKSEIGGGRFRRPLKYFRDGSTLFIPLSELTSYPFISGTNCFHYDSDGSRKLCVECTMGKGCEKVRESEESESMLPVGD